MRTKTTSRGITATFGYKTDYRKSKKTYTKKFLQNVTRNNVSSDISFLVDANLGLKNMSTQEGRSLLRKGLDVLMERVASLSYKGDKYYIPSYDTDS